MGLCPVITNPQTGGKEKEDIFHSVFIATCKPEHSLLHH